MVLVIIIVALWLAVAICAWAAVYSARTWRRPERRWRMRAVSVQQRQPRSGGLF